MVRVDTVYQRVLALANKEQRGYITPQEFNLLANQAQMAIFEQYFYDLDQFKRTPDNDDGTLSDMIELIKNKLSIFTNVEPVLNGTFPLNYRTGRFANSAEVTEVLMGPRGGLQSIDYTYRRNPYETFETFGRGWTRRVTETTESALKMI